MQEETYYGNLDGQPGWTIQDLFTVLRTRPSTSYRVQLASAHPWILLRILRKQMQQLPRFLRCYYLYVFLQHVLSQTTANVTRLCLHVAHWKKSIVASFSILIILYAAGRDPQKPFGYATGRRTQACVGVDADAGGSITPSPSPR